MEEIKVVLYEVGAVGELLARFLLEKQGVKIVGAVDVDEDKVDKDLGELLGLNKKLGITVSRDVASIFSKVKVDIAIHATTSHLKDTYPQIATLLGHHINVISTCEELPILFRARTGRKARCSR